MALTDFWELKDNQVFEGKSILNVYHLKRILPGADAGDVGTAFNDWVLDSNLKDLQPVGLTRTFVTVENLGDITDFATLSSSAHGGQVVGQEIPGFNAATIQFNRKRTDMKHGMKRFVAGTELEMDGGEWVGGFFVLLQALAAHIMLPWERDTAPGVDVVEFCILKRFCVVPAQDPCLAYRLPITDAEVDDNHYVPDSSTTRPRVRSQVSRKVLQ